MTLQNGDITPYRRVFGLLVGVYGTINGFYSTMGGVYSTSKGGYDTISGILWLTYRNI